MLYKAVFHRHPWVKPDFGAFVLLRAENDI